MTPSDPVPSGDPEKTRVVLITGVSGAGKSSALKALEDLGYEAVDNLPVSLLPRLVAPGDERHPLAVGIDIRTRDFNPGAILREVKELQRRDDLDTRLVFIDCGDDVLIERFRETRRRHPLAADRPVIDGLKQERDLLDPLRQRADMAIDTSEMHARELKRLMHDRFSLEEKSGLTILLTSFGFKNGLPRDADLVFDVRFLQNPHYERELRPLTGRDPAVAQYIEGDIGLEPFLANLTALLLPLIPRFAAEGKSYLTVAVGCTGGRHRSVYTTERLAARLGAEGLNVRLRHRDLAIPEK
jgi:UPF0042 nucleotide-binding protein